MPSASRRSGGTSRCADMRANGISVIGGTDRPSWRSPCGRFRQGPDQSARQSHPTGCRLLQSPSFRLYSGPPEHSTRGGFSQRPSSACFARTPSPTGASASVAASGLGDEDKFRRGVYSNGSRTGPLSAKDIPTDDPTFKGLSTLSWTANTRPKPPSSVYSIRTPT